MSYGSWKCQKCGYSTMCLIYWPPEKCPECKAEYEIIKWIHGAHIAHTIPVQRLKGTNKKNVAAPTVFMTGRNPNAVKEYFDEVEYLFFTGLDVWEYSAYQ